MEEKVLRISTNIILLISNLHGSDQFSKGQKTDFSWETTLINGQFSFLKKIISECLDDLYYEIIFSNITWTIS